MGWNPETIEEIRKGAKVLVVGKNHRAGNNEGTDQELMVRY